jgi:hypothetical protein
MFDFCHDGATEKRTAQLVEKAQEGALDAIREEIEGEDYLSSSDLRALVQACVTLSRTFPRAMDVVREIRALDNTEGEMEISILQRRAN